MLRKKELLPVVVFSFSKKRCEDHADSLPNQDLCGKDEKSEIHVIIERSLTRLKGSGRLALNTMLAEPSTLQARIRSFHR